MKSNVIAVFGFYPDNGEDTFVNRGMQLHADIHDYPKFEACMMAIYAGAVQVFTLGEDGLYTCTRIRCFVYMSPALGSADIWVSCNSPKVEEPRFFKLSELEYHSSIEPMGTYLRNKGILV